jgi:hypothetical protein
MYLERKRNGELINRGEGAYSLNIPLLRTNVVLNVLNCKLNSIGFKVLLGFEGPVSFLPLCQFIHCNRSGVPTLLKIHFVVSGL